MKTTFENDDVLVLDEVLPAEALRDLWEYVQAAAAQPVHVGIPRSPWRVTDGTPYHGVQNAAAWLGDVPVELLEGRTKAYPTATAIDPVFKILLENRDRFSAWSGEPGAAWDLVSACPFLYPQGAALSIHSDGGDGNYAGAYTFYVHPQWSVEWGGELMVWPNVPELQDHYRDAKSQRFESPGFWDRALASREDGRFFAARPNRLILVRGGTPHKIARVDLAAGAAVRAALSGFYLPSKTS